MSSPQDTPAVEVVVVGGGVIGLSVAWRLRRSGRSVLLAERGELGSGASSVAAGMLAPASEADFGLAGRTGLELGLAAAQRWPAFAASLAEAAGWDPGLRETGTLILARDGDEAQWLEREIRLRQSLGLRTHRLRPSAARALEPALAPTLRLALQAPDDHSIDPRRVTAALAVAVERAGVALRRHSPVARIIFDAARGRVSGVVLHGGERVAAENVVLCAGAWSGLLPGLPAAARIPVRPVKGQTLRLRDRSGAGLLDRVVRWDGGYLVPRGDGGYVLGATMEERGFDITCTAGGIYELLRAAQELVPGVAELAIEEMAAGLRPASPDNVPLIGLAALDGLIWATGHHRNGILLAPLTAEIVEEVMGTQPVSTLAQACSPARLAAVGATA